MRLFEEFKLYETMWDMSLKETVIDEHAIDACLARVNGTAGEGGEDGVAVSVSKDDLKKALRLGAYALYSTPLDKPVPAQLVDSIWLDFTSSIDIDEDYSQLNLSFGGDEVNEYFDDNVVFIQHKILPKVFSSEEEAIEYFENTIKPQASKIAHEMIESAWRESGYTDYNGITSEGDNTNAANDSDWEPLLAKADKLLKELITKSNNQKYDDGDGYWQEDYTTWCFRYLYHSTNLPNVAEVERLCDEYSKKLPNVTFYCVDDDYCSEIGYTAER
jgi:hypothetical protein